MKLECSIIVECDDSTTDERIKVLMRDTTLELAMNDFIIEAMAEFTIVGTDKKFSVRTERNECCCSPQ
jgi:phosphoenolpyruvate synthase/pyruvate phosphate dikinase